MRCSSFPQWIEAKTPLPNGNYGEWRRRRIGGSSASRMCFGRCGPSTPECIRLRPQSIRWMAHLRQGVTPRIPAATDTPVPTFRNRFDPGSVPNGAVNLDGSGIRESESFGPTASPDGEVRNRPRAERLGPESATGAVTRRAARRKSFDGLWICTHASNNAGSFRSRRFPLTGGQRGFRCRKRSSCKSRIRKKCSTNHRVIDAAQGPDLRRGCDLAPHCATVREDE